MPYKFETDHIRLPDNLKKHRTLNKKPLKSKKHNWRKYYDKTRHAARMKLYRQSKQLRLKTNK